MMVRRGVPLLVCLSASVTLAVAQPKKKKPPAPKPTPTAPAKEPAPTPEPTPVPGSAEAPPPVDEGPPADMEGKDENPNAPRIPGEEPEKVDLAVAAAPKRTGYPTEEALRPITLPRNMAEVSLDSQAQLDVPDDVGYAGSSTLRARYGITRKVQLGLTYTVGGIYDDPQTTERKVKFKPGKALGLDVTVLIKDWVGVRVGVPVWIYKPEGGGAPAIGLTIGAPLKFRFGDKLAFGGLDDLLAIKLTKFAPTFEYEYLNAQRAYVGDIGTPSPRGFIRLAGYGVYQQSSKLALIGRIGITFEDFTSTATQSDRGGGSTTFLRAGVEYTVRPYLDLGASIGFEDLSAAGTFGPRLLLAFRI